MLKLKQTKQTRKKGEQNDLVMPLFTKKSNKTSSPTQLENNNLKNTMANATILPTQAQIIEKKIPQPLLEPTILKPQLVFHCQLAHGSPTGLISGFASVKELYQKIAECYDFSVDEVIHQEHAVILYFSSLSIQTAIKPARDNADNDNEHTKQRNKNIYFQFIEIVLGIKSSSFDSVMLAKYKRSYLN